MARDRKPVELKVLNGNPGKAEISPAVTITTERPKPPQNLRGEAFAEWCRVTDYLSSVGRIETIDYAGLVVYCTAWQTFESAREELDRHGPLVTGRDGGLVKNPAAQVMEQAAKIMLAYGAKFGCTPKDRQNLGIRAPEAEGDELDDLLAG